MNPGTKSRFSFYGFGHCYVIIVLSLSLHRKLGVAADKCSDVSSGIEIKANWWSIRPYAIKTTEGNYTNMEGLFPKLFKALENQTGIKIKYGEQYSTYSNLSKSVGEDNQTLFFPVIRKEEYSDACYITVVETHGPAYFIHIEEIIPLRLLGKGLLQGWQVIALTIVLAAISGIFIWIMDRNSNPQDFPPGFIPGVWQGFWWAFVTMTTVGYGDTAPRSIPARLYSILWMIIGMIAFSVLTANITSSLSQRTFDAEEKLFGKKVGVLAGTMDATAALVENANVLGYNSVKELLSSMKAGNVDGILMERYIAGAYYNIYKEQGLELGTTLKFPYHIGLQVPNSIPGLDCQMFTKCVQEILNEDQIATKFLTDLSKEWRSFSNSDSTSLFEDESFFYILIAFFFALCGAGGLWHYFVFLPQQKQEKESAEANLEAGNNVNEEEQKIILIKKELEMFCQECREKVETLVTEHPDRNFHESAFPFHLGLPIGTQHLKRLSSNALSQLKNVPGNAVDQIPGFIGRRKQGRVI